MTSSRRCAGQQKHAPIHFLRGAPAPAAKRARRPERGSCSWSRCPAQLTNVPGGGEPPRTVRPPARLRAIAPTGRHEPAHSSGRNEGGGAGTKRKRWGKATLLGRSSPDFVTRIPRILATANTGFDALGQLALERRCGLAEAALERPRCRRERARRRGERCRRERPVEPRAERPQLVGHLGHAGAQRVPGLRGLVEPRERAVRERRPERREDLRRDRRREAR